MAEAWPAGVPHKLIRDTYERAPEDVVKRHAVDVGPPLRQLLAGSRAQKVSGELLLTETQFEALKDWRRTVLDFGLTPFDFTLYDHAAPRTLTARFLGGPEARQPRGSKRRVKITLRTDPVAPSGAFLTTLAGLDKAAPATWPASVPGCPRKADYQAAQDSQVRRPEDLAPASGALVSRLEGTREQVSLTLSTAELQAFEAWFEAEAALGARDVDFPVPGGFHLGCFDGTYTVRAAGEQSGWRVSFVRYLEARP